MVRKRKEMVSGGLRMWKRAVSGVTWDCVVILSHVCHHVKLSRVCQVEV